MIRSTLTLLCALLVSWACPTWADDQPATGPDAPASADSAEQRYEQAQQLYLDKRYADALPLFQQLADQADSPNARLYVARCLREMHRLVDAYRHMRRTAEEAEARAVSEPRFAGTRDAAKRELDELRAQLVLVTLVLASKPEGLDLELNGNPVSASELSEPIPALPGALELQVRAKGFEPRTIERQTEAGQALSLAVVLTPLADTTTAKDAAVPPAIPDRPAPRTSSGPGWLIGGIAALTLGVAGWVMLGVTGTKANDLHDRVSAACGGTHCPDQSHEDDIDEGELMDILANVGLGVGIAGTLAGGVLIGVHLASDDGAEPRVAVRPHPGGASLLLRF